MRRLLLIIGIILIASGLIISCSIIVAVVVGKHSHSLAVEMASLVFFGALPVIAGILVCREAEKPTPRSSEAPQVARGKDAPESVAVSCSTQRGSRVNLRLLIIGVIFIVFASMMTCLAAISAAEHRWSFTLDINLAYCVVFCLLPLIAGILFCLEARRSRQRPEEPI